MARAVPMLPCGPLDETVDFYRALGVEVMERQEKPYAYAAMRRDDIDCTSTACPTGTRRRRTRPA